VNKEEMEKEITFLEARIKLAKTFQEKLDLKDRIVRLRMKINGVEQPTDFDIECVSCGS